MKPKRHWKSNWRGGDRAEFCVTVLYCRQVVLATSDRLVLYHMMPSELTRCCRIQLCRAPSARGPMKNEFFMPAFTERWGACNRQPMQNAYMMQTRVSATCSILSCCCCCVSQAVSFFIVPVNNSISSSSLFPHHQLIY